MNVWKSIIVGLLGILFLVGCGGNKDGNLEEVSLEEYFSKTNLDRVCIIQNEKFYDGLYMSDTGDSVDLITVDEHNNVESEYTYGLRIGTDRVWLTDEAGDEDECLVVRKTGATQFQCNTAGTADWYHTLEDAKKNPSTSCVPPPDSNATKALKKLLEGKTFYRVDTYGTHYSMYFSNDGIFEKNATNGYDSENEDNGETTSEHSTYKIKDTLTFGKPFEIYTCTLVTSDERSVTMDCTSGLEDFTWVIWGKQEDAIENPKGSYAF